MAENRDRLNEVYRQRAGLSDRYSLANRGNLFNFESLYHSISDSLKSSFDNLEDIRMLDLGAGELFWTDKIVSMGITPDKCVASDLLQWRLAKGHEKGRLITAVSSSAAALPFKSNSFDLVSQLTMMTSVLDKEVRREIAGEMVRVLRPGGYILWYDFRYNNPVNKNTRAIGKNELAGLFDGQDLKVETVTVIPQIARKIGPISFPLLKFVSRFPILRSHYLALIGPKG